MSSYHPLHQGLRRHDDEIEHPAGEGSQNRGKSNPGTGRGGRSSGKKEDPEPPQEDYRAQFYDYYRKEAEEHDKEFMKKYDEDLNTTLIFAGLFSAVTSAFIIEVNSQLQPDPNDETAALLRVLIYKIDNTTFGEHTPSIPQWTGPPRAIVQVQAILFASLTASLFSAFLAMLGKQWLNRYASIDMRGSAIERSQNRQRKLDGIVAWYFDYVMESLPLMLQAALLLLGCALSQYLWGVNTIVASVVLSVTSFGVLAYLLILIAGAASVSCPYQTPGAQLLRRIPDALHNISDAFCHIPDTFRRIPNIPGLFRSVFSAPIEESAAVARGMSQQGLEQHTDLLDIHCISWTLQTSLDAPVRLSALNYLTATTLAEFNPTLVAGCFDVLFSCLKPINDKAVVVVRGMERLAALSPLCCLHTLSHLIVVDPTSRVLDDTRQRYVKAFRLGANFNGLPSAHILGAIHAVFYPTRRSPLALRELHRRDFPEPRQDFMLAAPLATLLAITPGIMPEIRWEIRQQVSWEDYEPSGNEHVMIARALTKIAWFTCQRGWKVPRWLFRFALHSLSLDPLPPTSVIVNSLSIIAIDLGCDPWTIVTLDESLRLDEISRLITQKLTTMTETAHPDPGPLHFRYKAINALCPYAVYLWRHRQREVPMADAVSLAARVAGQWSYARPFVTGHAFRHFYYGTANAD